MLTQEQRDIQGLARDFATEVLRAGSAAWDHKREFDDTLVAQMAETGFFGLRVPEAFGGLGLDLLTWVVTLEELAWGDPAAAAMLGVHGGPVVEALVRGGSSAQQEEWLPGLASGDSLGAAAFAANPEPLTCARADEGVWALSGTHSWVLNADRAAVVLVQACGAEASHSFIVSADHAGVTLGARALTSGFRACHTAGMNFDTMLPPDSVLGELGPEGSAAVRDVGRLGLAAVSVGLGRAAWDHAVAYAQERRQFGRAIASFGAIQDKLAQTRADLLAAQALVRQCAAQMEGALAASSHCAAAKLVASRAAMLAADEAVQIFGGYGYMREYPVEKLMRDAKGTQVLGGSDEQLRHDVARDALTETDID